MTVAIAVEAAPLQVDKDGVVRVGKTRVILDLVVAAYHEGCTPEEINERYTSPTLDEIYSALGYYLRHRDELDAYLRERALEAEEMRKEIESKYDPVALRNRLAARWSAKKEAERNAGTRG